MDGLAGNRPPAFERFGISGFPVRQYRHDPEAWLDREGECCLVLKPDIHGAIFRGQGQLHVGNDLALDLRKMRELP